MRMAMPGDGADEIAAAPLTVLTQELQASLPASAHGAQALDQWSLVSARLQELQFTWRQQFDAQQAEYERLAPPPNAITSHSHGNDNEDGNSNAAEVSIASAQHELDALLPEMSAADLHFQAVQAKLAPVTQRLAVLSAQATYLEMAMHIETLSKRVERHVRKSEGGLDTLPSREEEKKETGQDQAFSMTDDAAASAATAAALPDLKALAAGVAGIPKMYAALRREAQRCLEALTQQLKVTALQTLVRALTAIDWPQPQSPSKDDPIKSVGYDAVARAFADLLALQLYGQQQQEQTQEQAQEQPPLAMGKSEEDTSDGDEWWALACVLEPVRLRFRFHFERRESATNRVTKPEWWLGYVVAQTREHAAFLDTVLTPALQRVTEGNRQGDTGATALKRVDGGVLCVDAKLLFLRGLICMAMRKLRQDLPVLLADRAVLCHTVDELVLFEQSVDDVTQGRYDAYANASRRQFPRCMDVLTSSPKTLFAWASMDAAYAEDTINEWMQPPAIPPTVPMASWMVTLAPRVMTLLDFLAARFTFLARAEHRYVYITQVHFVLLQRVTRELHTQARRRGSRVREALAQQLGSVVTRHALDALLEVVGAADTIVDELTAWEQSALFLEVTKAVAASETSRRQILQLHLAHSQTMLRNAAREATARLMAREEATAVRAALAGPGALIGPTAALSAAYSVGSQTMKSLFGRNESTVIPTPESLAAKQEEEQPEHRDPQGDGNETSENLTVQQEEERVKEAERAAEREREMLLFSRSIFERPVTEASAVSTEALAAVERVIMERVQRALREYRASPHWTSLDKTEHVLVDVSCELRDCWTQLQDVLTTVVQHLSASGARRLWRPLLVAIDDAVSQTAMHILSPPTTVRRNSTARPLHGESIEPLAWTSSARAQFVVDVQALSRVIGICVKQPNAYLRKSCDVCRVLEMAPPKRMELLRAMSSTVSIASDTGYDAASGSDSMEMEQITTMLEACGILALSPQQVHDFAVHQMGLRAS